MGHTLFPLDADTADLGGELVREWRSHGITLTGPDALIAATALRHQAGLVTTNVRDFPMPDLNVLTVDMQGTLLWVPPADRRPTP